MASKILYHLAIFILVAAMSLLAGSWPGRLKVHPSGDASYIYGSHCLVSTEVPAEKFQELTAWCVETHKHQE